MRTMVEKNKILELETGSHLYGTNTPTSDKDYSGVFIADPRFYFGLQSVEEVDMSIVSKDADGKNTQDAIDIKFYEIRKFVKLALDNNPNIIEQLFTPKTVFSNGYGKTLLDNAHLFPHKGSAAKFLGYAKSQLHKMRVKPENYEALANFKEYYEYAMQTKFQKEFIKDMEQTAFWKEGNQFFQIGDLKFNGKVKMSDVYDSVCERINKAGSRTELFLKHGYDVKFGMHLIRLMYEGIDLLRYGNLSFPFISAKLDVLMDIRKGAWTVEEVIKYAEELEAEVKELEKTSKLPDKPRTAEVEKLLISLVTTFHEELKYARKN